MDTTVTYIDRHDSLRPVGPQATQSLLDEKKIPTLQEQEYQQWADYLFSSPFPLRLQVAETVLRHDRQHSYALPLFLACTALSAAYLTRRLAHKLFFHPPDLTLELMYDAAMNTLMTFPKKDFILAETGFRTFLFTAMRNRVLTAVPRIKKSQLQTFGSSSDHPRHPRLDEQISAKQMLDKIANFQPAPQTPAYLNRFLRCLARLQPDDALTPSTNPQNVKHRLKRDSRKGPIMLDLEPTFNPDGTLFLTKSKPASKQR